MKQWEVAFGAVFYFDHRDAEDRHGRKVTRRLRRTATKGDLIELDDKQAARLVGLGAICEPGKAPKAEPDTEPEIIAGDYSDRKAEELQAEANRRELVVTGTGNGGNVLKRDLVAALEADDADSEDEEESEDSDSEDDKATEDDDGGEPEQNE